MQNEEKLTAHLSKGKRLRFVRELLNMTQKELGSCVGRYPQSSVYDWEKRDLDIPNEALVGLEKLGVSLPYLISGKGEPFINQAYLSFKKQPKNKQTFCF